MALRGPSEGKGTGVALQGIPSHPLLVSSMKLIEGSTPGEWLRGGGATHRVSRKQEGTTATREPFWAKIAVGSSSPRTAKIHCPENPEHTGTSSSAYSGNLDSPKTAL